jgi:hypothetical protein
LPCASRSGHLGAIPTCKEQNVSMVSRRGPLGQSEFDVRSMSRRAHKSAMLLYAGYLSRGVACSTRKQTGCLGRSILLVCCTATVGWAEPAQHGGIEGERVLLVSLQDLGSSDSIIGWCRQQRCSCWQMTASRWSICAKCNAHSNRSLLPRCHQLPAVTQVTVDQGCLCSSSSIGNTGAIL